MRTITFEKLTGPIYPAYLRVGDYSIALEPELIQSLKEIVAVESSSFFKGLIEQVGQNRYLKEMIEKEITKENDLDALADELKKALLGL